MQKEATDSLICEESSQSATNTDAIMITFQQTMLQMTNNFLQTQQQVMLAYLQVKSGRFSQTTQWLPMPSEQGEVPLQPIQSRKCSKLQATVQLQIEEPSTSLAVEKNVHVGSTDSENRTPPAAFPETSNEFTAPVHEVRSTEELISRFIDLVSERTGYPPEMLEPSLDLESDLGIDSIKRVEIFSNFKRLLPEEMQEKLEGELDELGGMRTLEAIYNWIRNIPIAAQAEINDSASEGA
ncbi:MAG: hypothetical protein K2Y39_16840 [Candidatus Obscuribacterales bacterium]|nr:hypothetical protein [Candidatus Obscuribacterales bacterium]